MWSQPYLWPTRIRNCCSSPLTGWHKVKTWRLPQGGRTAKGKAIVNILPIPTGVSIRQSCPWMCPRKNGTTCKSSLPHPRATYAEMHCQISQMSVQTAKSRWTCPGIELVNARIAGEDDDVMLFTNSGRAIRFSTTDVRVFKGRKSTGVRGIRLIGEDRVVSMSIIRHFDATSDERAAYLKMRRAIAGMVDEDGSSDEEGVSENATISRALCRDVSGRKPDPNDHKGRIRQNVLKP